MVHKSGSPWSRYLRACSLVSFWSSSPCLPLLTNPRTVRVDGTTDLHNYYPEAWQRRDQQKHVAKSDLTFSTKRTRRTARAVARLHARLSSGQRVYLITHTMDASWDDRDRRVAFRRFLDRLRKVSGYRGHLWTTERHHSGALHHHVAVRFGGFWDYKQCIQRWSCRYCGSVNGLRYHRRNTVTLRHT